MTRLKNILQFLWTAIVFWVCCTLFFELIAVSLVPLGPWYSLTIKLIAPLVSVPISFSLAVCPRCRQKRPTTHTRMSRKQVLVLVGACIVVVAIGSLPTLSERTSRDNDAKRAMEHFELAYVGSNAEKARVERTLAELERARYRIAKEWSQPDETALISLYLYRDIREYRAAADQIWSGGATVCLVRGASIGVPLENASTLFSEDNASNTPLHEIVHVLMCQSLGKRAFYSLPRWFHEGMAELYAGDGLSRISQRPLNRLNVWLQRQQLMHPELFCSYAAEGSPAEISLSYRTAWEFSRSLEGRYGRAALTMVIESVAAGATFEDSLRDQLGGTCTELYTAWLRSFVN